MNFTDEQIEKLAIETGCLSEDLILLWNMVAKSPSALTLRELEDLPLLAGRCMKALLRRIEQDEKRERDQYLHFEWLGEKMSLHKGAAFHFIQESAEGMSRNVTPDPLSLPAKERKWTMVQSEKIEPGRYWVTCPCRNRRMVYEDYSTVSQPRIASEAIAYMPRVEGEDPPPPYLGPIPAVDGWEGER